MRPRRPLAWGIPTVAEDREAQQLKIDCDPALVTALTGDWLAELMVWQAISCRVETGDRLQCRAALNRGAIHTRARSMSRSASYSNAPACCSMLTRMCVLSYALQYGFHRVVASSRSFSMQYLVCGHSMDCITRLARPSLRPSVPLNF